MSTLIGLLRNTCGLTSIEYALIAAAVAVGLVVGLGALGDHLSASYGHTTTGIKTAVGLD